MSKLLDSLKVKFLVARRHWIKILNLLVLLFCLPSLCQAALDLELTKGVKARVPIAVVPFSQQGVAVKPPVDVSQVITADLRYSGQFRLPSEQAMTQRPYQVSQVKFNYWRSLGVSAILIGQVQSQGEGQYLVSATLVNLFKNKKPTVPQTAQSAAYDPANNPVLFHVTFTVNKAQLRQVAHRIANRVYQDLLGLPGYFTTRLAYVGVTQQPIKGLERYNLMLADYDGYDAYPLLSSNQPLAAPSWSPDGKYLAYVSYENGGQPAVYQIDVKTKQRKLLAEFPGGVNDKPVWSPNGKQLALVLAKTGVPKIYLLNLTSGKLTQLTHGWSVDTDPAWMPDGKSLVFVSNRSGSPQLYQLNLTSDKAKLVTYNGGYNASPNVASNGEVIALLHGAGGQYNIALLNLKLGQFELLTSNGLAHSPSFSPLGNLVVYSTYLAGHENLAMVSSDGSVQFDLPNPLGLDQRQPAWSSQ